MLLLTAKNIAIFFGLATTAFCVSTIVLAVQKSELEDDLQNALDKLDMISTVVTPTTSSTTALTPSSSDATSTAGPPASTPDPSTPTAGPPVPTSDPSTPGAGESSSTSSSTTQTVSLPPWPTAPHDGPTFPTLPPGLPNPEKVIYRLPNEIRPIKYKIYIHPDLENKTCEGTVSIQIEIDVQTNLIVMHARDLEIEAISILNMMGRMRIRIKEYYLAIEREMLFIELEELLFTSTPYVVSISYRCQLDGLSGIYASSYLGDSGDVR